MSILALGGVLPLLLILACPLMMVLMMFGMHGHGHGHAGRQAPPDEAQPPRQRMTLEELKRERDELNALIGDRAEQAADREAANREPAI
ncbi:MAG TPA: DUF2933 domain-containing protein [Gaiellaceae bacterium]